MVYLVKLKEGDPMVVVSSLVCSIYRAIEEKQKAVIVDTEWMDLEATSDRLKKYSNIFKIQAIKKYQKIEIIIIIY